MKTRSQIWVAMVMFSAIAPASAAGAAGSCEQLVENRGDCKIAVDRVGGATQLPYKVTPKSKVTLETLQSPVELVKFEESTSLVAEPDLLAALLKTFTPQLAAFPFRMKSRNAMPNLGTESSAPAISGRIKPADAELAREREFMSRAEEVVRLLEEVRALLDEAGSKLHDGALRADGLAREASYFGKVPLKESWASFEDAACTYAKKVGLLPEGKQKVPADASLSMQRCQKNAALRVAPATASG